MSREPAFRKSSFSSGGNCVEVAFRKSSFSLDTGTCVEVGFAPASGCGSSACVEVGRDGTEVLVRDSKDLSIAPMRFTAAEWSAFTAGVRAGEFDV